MLEGGLEHERLEGRAGLPARTASVGAPHEVDREGVVVPAADVGTDGAVRVERHQRGLRPRRIGGDLRDGGLGGGLGVEVEGRDHAEPPAVERILADGLDGLLPDPLDEVGREPVGGRRGRRAIGGFDRGGLGRIGLRLRDGIVVDHVRQDGGPAGSGLVHVLDGVGGLR